MNANNIMTFPPSQATTKRIGPSFQRYSVPFVSATIPLPWLDRKENLGIEARKVGNVLWRYMQMAKKEKFRVNAAELAKTTDMTQEQVERGIRELGKAALIEVLGERSKPRSYELAILGEADWWQDEEEVDRSQWVFAHLENDLSL